MTYGRAGTLLLVIVTVWQAVRGVQGSLFSLILASFLFCGTLLIVWSDPGSLLNRLLTRYLGFLDEPFRPPPGSAPKRPPAPTNTDILREKPDA